MSSSVANICNCFAARHAARFITQVYERHLAKAGITGPQYTILAVVGAYPGIAMTELARHMSMDRTSVVRALKPLYRDGYVSDAPSESDSRKMLLSLTRSGMKKLEQATRHWQAAQDEWEQKLGAERAEALRRELVSITDL